MYKQDLALNNLQWLVCYKIKPNLSVMVGYIQALETYNSKSLYQELFQSKIFLLTEPKYHFQSFICIVFMFELLV